MRGSRDPLRARVLLPGGCHSPTETPQNPHTHAPIPRDGSQQGTAGLTVGDEGLRGAGVAQGVGGGAAVLPPILRPHAADLQAQGISGGRDGQPLAGGHLRAAGGHEVAVAVQRQGGRRAAVHRAVHHSQPAALRLLQQRQGGGPGGVCGTGRGLRGCASPRRTPSIVALPGRLRARRGHPAQLLLGAAFPLTSAGYIYEQRCQSQTQGYFIFPLTCKKLPSCHYPRWLLGW